MISERYSRQILFRKIGEAGQEKLLASTVTVVGMGALGCVNANELVRAGVGHLRIIDRDVVDLSNLQRQVLYTEKDAAASVPKVFAAVEHLGEANSEVQVDPIYSELNAENAEELLGGADLIVDATDNLETRYLINEYCVKHAVPWVYGGAVGAQGMTAAFVPGGPCFSCFSGHSGISEGHAVHTANTNGILNSLTAIIASLEVTEALKILTGSDAVRKEALYIELWDNEFFTIPIEQDPSCPVCIHHSYTHLAPSV